MGDQKKKLSQRRRGAKFLFNIPSLLFAPLRLCVSFFFILFFNCMPVNIHAQYFYMPPLVSIIDNVPDIVSRAAVLVDAETGALIYSKNGDDGIPPASLTKLMTMHLVMKEIEEGRASYDEIVPITEESWAQRQPPQSSLMFLEPGQTVTLREILLGLAVASGNDAAVAAALRVKPNMNEFAALMTEEARRMGLTVTRFSESSGYSPLNITTANEFAYFCYQYLKLHPESIKDFHSVPEISYPHEENIRESKRNNFNTITQYNRNTLLRRFEGVDGLKTGFIPESGYNIALTAQREQTRFILVILGAPSQRGGSRIREADGMRLLTWAFKNFKTVRQKIEPLENVRLWKGKKNKAQITIGRGQIAPETPPKDAHNELYAAFTSPVNRGDNISYEVVINGNLIAPLAKGHPVGHLVISDEYGELHRALLVTAEAYERGNVFKRIWHSFLLLFNK